MRIGPLELMIILPIIAVVAATIIVVVFAARKRHTDIPQGDVSSKSRLAVVLLTWFLGGLGLHRFYIGKVFSGLVILILMIVGYALALSVSSLTGGLIFVVVGLWILIDFIMAIAGTMKDKEGRPIKNW